MFVGLLDKCPEDGPPVVSQLKSSGLKAGRPHDVSGKEELDTPLPVDVPARPVTASSIYETDSSAVTVAITKETNGQSLFKLASEESSTEAESKGPTMPVTPTAQPLEGGEQVHRDHLSGYLAERFG